VAWAKDLSDQKQKASYYPRVDKKDLFRLGYIAEKSGHSRGSTVDLTIDGLDMGTPYDFFDEQSHTENAALSDSVRSNRQMLKSAMESAGFKNLPEEWWHYTLRSEPYPDRFFNFSVE
jgi:D-alanyl-D-alanine dipeptidase